jgi:hypothetical protein
MAERLTWEQIEARYDKQWVELVDVNWPEEDINPRAGVVRVHAQSREEFDKLVGELPLVDSALVFVGTPDLPDSVIMNTFNRIQVKPVHA